ncbi:MAG TPA: 30S ribosomal protein S4 [Candidatus Limnocylindria bacterium]|jgi:small subunit ribosomal protein S4|nr:30S ribosomal protein S4 [Candidatus Limnocylindria bacterium]
MSRYRGPVSRLCRREGMKLYLKGAKCYTKKCPFEKRPTPPGQHGIRRRKMSDYGVQLREKQKMRRVYSIHERQFKRYFDSAENRPGVTGENLLRFLETRLDNVVFRMGFATSRAQARQLVSHGHFTVNGRATTVPSYQVREGDTVEVRATSRKADYFKQVVDALRAAQRPDWLDVDVARMIGSVTALPRRDQMPLELNEQLVVEFYSR